MSMPLVGHQARGQDEGSDRNGNLALHCQPDPAHLCVCPHEHLLISTKPRNQMAASEPLSQDF